MSVDPPVTDMAGNTTVSIYAEAPQDDDGPITVTLRSATDPAAFDTVQINVHRVSVTLNPTSISLSTQPNDANHSATVTIRVVDAVTGQPVPSANISIVTDPPNQNSLTITFGLGGGALIPMTDGTGFSVLHHGRRRPGWDSQHHGLPVRG